MNSSLTSLTSLTEYCPVANYSKLIRSYNKVKAKLELKNQENNKLKGMLNDMIHNYQIIRDNQKSTESLIYNIQTSMKSILAQKTKIEEYSTTTSFIEYRNTSKIAFNQFNVINKVEEIEKSYYEMSKSFNDTVKKYKILQEDYQDLNYYNTELVHQLQLQRIDNEKYKDIDKCLLDFTMNNLVLQSENSDQEVKMLNCEPVPSFLKFIKKA